MVIWYILIGIAVFIGLLMLLPSKVHVERSLAIQAPASAIFEQVNNLKNWPSWMPWAKFDPNMEYTYYDGGEGPGAAYSWKSDHKKVGNGKLTILESEKPSQIKTKLEFGDQPKPGYGAWVFSEKNGETVVTWSMDADMGNNPVGKLFGLFMDKMLGPSFEDGLSNIRSIVESKNEA